MGYAKREAVRSEYWGVRAPVGTSVFRDRGYTERKADGGYVEWRVGAKTKTKG